MKFKKGNIIRVGSKDGCIVINHKNYWVDYVEPYMYDYEYLSSHEDRCEYISEGSVDLLNKWYKNQKKYLQYKKYYESTEVKFKNTLCSLKEWKKVEKEYYEEWIKNYENTYNVELINHSIYFCSPPIHGKYDFSLNPIDKDGTVCMVAKIVDSGWYGRSSLNEYYVVSNIDEVFEFIKGYKK